MNCRTLSARISLYFDERLTSPEREAAEAHLRSCPRCSRSYADLSRSLAKLDALPRLAPPVAGRAKLLASISAAPAQGRRVRLSFAHHAALAGAVALVAVAVGLSMLPRTGDVKGGRTRSEVAFSAPAPVPVAPAAREPRAEALSAKPAAEEQVSAVRRQRVAANAGTARRHSRRVVAKAPPVEPTLAQVPKPTSLTSESTELEPDPEYVQTVQAGARRLTAQTAEMVSEGMGPLVAAAEVEEDPIGWISDVDVEDWL